MTASFPFSLVSDKHMLSLKQARIFQAAQTSKEFQENHRPFSAFCLHNGQCPALPFFSAQASAVFSRPLQGSAPFRFFLICPARDAEEDIYQVCRLSFLSCILSGLSSACFLCIPLPL